MRVPRPLARSDAELQRLLVAAGANAERAAGLLEQLVEAWPDAGELAAAIADCEQAGDRLVRDVGERLGGSAERERLYPLATGLEDITDRIDEVADFFSLYRIEAPMSFAQEQAGLLHLACARLAEAIPRLGEPDAVRRLVEEVARHEDDGDRVVREAFAALFEAGIDPMLVIRWKDIYERLEDALDATRRIAGLLEALALRPA